MVVQRGPMPSWDQCCATATHSPVLAAMLAKTEGDVLELGTGHYSTPFLHFICQPNRFILSIDTDERWISFFKENFSGSHHEYICTDDDLISTALLRNSWCKGKKWGLAFVDCNPEIDRKECIRILRDKADYIVVHDSEPLATAYQWGDIFETFKYRFYYDVYHNGTTVISDTKEIPIE